MKQTFLKLALLLTVLLNSLAFSQNKIEIKGIIVDETDFPIPYAAVGIPSKYIGTASTEDGTFLLKLSNENLRDSLEISSIGYKSIKVLVKDYITSKQDKIVLQEDIVSLNEVNLMSPRDYARLCMKNLRKTTLSQPHKLDILYRRFSSEEGKTRFLVEHYLHVIDRGPTSPRLDKLKVVEGRKSADYRYAKRKSPEHNMIWTGKHNPVRPYLEINDYNWKREGDTSYDNEDIMIVEGRKKNNNNQYVRLYIGLDTYSLFKIESSNANSTYIYKKTVDGKLYLSYHTRVAKGKVKLNDHQRKLLKTTKKSAVANYKHEVYILGLDTNKKNFKFDNYGEKGIDMGDLKVKYNPEFWQNISLPPDTKFYTQNVKEIESIYGVPMEKQFKVVNK